MGENSPLTRNGQAGNSAFFPTFTILNEKFVPPLLPPSPLGDKNLEGEQYLLITNEESDEQAWLNQHFGRAEEGGREGGGGASIVHGSLLMARYARTIHGNSLRFRPLLIHAFFRKFFRRN